MGTININQQLERNIEKRDIALCKRYTELTTNKGVSSKKALRIITELEFFIPIDRALEIISKNQK